MPSHTGKFDPMAALDDAFPKSSPHMDESFRQAWEQWIQHRKEIRHPLTPVATTMQLKLLGGMPVRDAIATINNSILSGYQGLFPCVADEDRDEVESAVEKHLAEWKSR